MIRPISIINCQKCSHGPRLKYGDKMTHGILIFRDRKLVSIIPANGGERIICLLSMNEDRQVAR